MTEAIANLLEEKANTDHVFSEDEAALDLYLNCQGVSQRKLATRWNWNPSSVFRKHKNLLEKSVQYFGRSEALRSTTEALPPLNNTIEADFKAPAKHFEAVAKQNGDFSESQKEGSFPPHTPPYLQEKPPSKKENPPKGGQKKETFPPQISEIGVSGDGSLVPVEITIEPLSVQPQTAEAAPPFTVTDAEEYFRSRLASGEAGAAAARRGYTAERLADKFYHHWEARDWVPEKGNPITSKSWKRRAATWWNQKENYDPNPQPLEAKKKVFGGERKLGAMY